MKLRLFVVLLLVPAFVLFSQDADGGDDTENGESFGFGSAGESAAPALGIGGEVSAKLLGFFDDFGSSGKMRKMQLGDIFEGKLNFSASAKAADGIINLKLTPEFSGASPISIDEAFVRLYLGPVDIEGGLRKLTWGRADSFGPLDVINPYDLSDLSDIGSPRNIKLARPMLHVSWNIGSFSRLEGVFVPWFEGNRYALTGRWAPVQVTGLPGLVQSDLINYLIGLGITVNPSDVQPVFDAWTASYDPYPKTNTFEYAQGGLRFTTTIGVSDLGVQYYFGRLPRPAFAVDIDKPGFFTPALPPPLDYTKLDFTKIKIFVDYNYYHQIGVDYARVIAGFNLRAEAGVNITNDLKGDDGTVYNPHVVWSLGFDRDLIWGINLNLQGNGLVRLMYGKIGDDPLTDTEAGKDLSSTRITAILSKKFFQDELELKATALWGIEDKDFLIIPAIVWSKNDITAELSAGFFGGDKTGELGQYRDNCYIKTILTWSF